MFDFLTNTEIHSSAWSVMETTYGGRSDLGRYTARDVFEGRVTGDAYYVVDTEALDFDLHALREVIDVYEDDDNGKVVLELSSRNVHVDPVTLVLVENAMDVEPHSRLPAPCPPPMGISLDGLVHEETHPVHGILGVVNKNAMGVVIWRPDGRHKKFTVLGVHGTTEYAVHELFRYREFTPRVKKPNRPRDYQRERVYRWEPQDHIDLAPVEARDLVTRVFEDFDIGRPCAVEVNPKLKRKSYYSKLHGIQLAPAWGLNRGVVIHETAHAIKDRMKLDGPSHGPAFVGVYMELLVRYCGQDRDHLIRTAHDGGVDFTPMTQ